MPVSLVSRLNAVLNYRISIEPEARISRNKAVVLLLLTAVMMILVGLLLGNTFFSAGKTSYYENRIEELREVLRENPEDRDTALELAMTIYLKGDAGEGIDLARQILAQAPSDKNAIFNLGLMLSDQGNFRESIELLEKLFKIYPRFNDSRARFYLGKSYFEAGNYRQALVNFELAVNQEPGSSVAFYYLGRANESLGNSLKAADAYRQAIFLAGTFPEAESALSRLPR